MKRKFTDSKPFSIGCGILSILIFLAVWELLVDNNVLVPLMFGNLPSPSRVIKEAVNVFSDSEYYVHILYSCARVATGCVIALVLGVLLGLLTALNKYCRYFFQPILDILRPVPQITWIPISILLFPTVEGSIGFITFLGAFFPIWVNTAAGVDSISPNLIAAAVSMHTNKLQRVWHVYIPGALPGIFVGLSVGMGTSWMSVIAAEMISGKFGIGYYTWMSYNLMRYEDTIIGMFTIGAVGLLSFALLGAVQGAVLRYQKRN